MEVCSQRSQAAASTSGETESLLIDRMGFTGKFALLLFMLLETTASAQMPDVEVNRRVDALLKQMTLQEKIGQLNQLFYFPNPVPGMPVATDEKIEHGDYGSFLFITDPAVINRLQHIAVERSRLHIPLLFGFDVIHGFRTIFPVPLAVAATWDPSVAEHGQAIAAKEASAAGVRWAFGPMVDIARDPRWGRIVEGAGEDPYLGAAIARAQVRGFQGEYLGAPGHVMTSVKHFAGYGAAEGGRDYDSSFIPEDVMRNVYLPPFRAAVEAGSGTVMSAYMDLNNVPATGNPFLLQQVLRKEWGFQGFVVSDAFAVRDLATHGYAKDAEDAAFIALNAGVNMDMGSETYLNKTSNLVEEKRISGEQIDALVLPILAAKFRLGLFENPYVDEAAAKRIGDLQEHRQAARAAAQRSAVLLRNEGGLLPLSLPSLAGKSIALIGPLADSQEDIRGPWALADDASRAVSVLAGLREKAANSVRIETAKGCDIQRVYPSFFDAITGAKPSTPLTDEQNTAEIKKAVDLASRSDLSILVLGELQKMSGEAASRSSLDLPGRQEELLERVVATGKPVVLVLMNGRPLSIGWAAEHVPAILEAWWPGAEGGHAVTDLLFGDANPGGKLPVTFPRSVGQVPIYYAHNLTHQPDTAPNITSRYWDIPTSPLYPFGFGLSYTSFAITNLQVKSDSVNSFSATVEVQNTGNRSGDEVVQFYIHQQAGSTSRPVRLLKGFERITLNPQQKKTVQFKLGKDELSYWSTQAKDWVMEPGTFDVWAGNDSNAALHSTLTVTH